MDREFEMVKKFHEAFGHPVSESPKALPIERRKNRADWIEEEVREFVVAEDKVDQADALIDAMYFCLGTLVEMGIKPDGLFEIVQEANMSKLFPDGKPRYREGDGKVLKPEGWEPPEPKLKEEVERQERENN